jgi:uncharacterized membrane protein
MLLLGTEHSAAIRLFVRVANYFGSIAHWIYPTLLRHKRQAWSTLMWWLSLVATIGASIGVMIGIVRLPTGAPYRGLQRWHHTFGLVLAPFILCWIFSGFRGRARAHLPGTNIQVEDADMKASSARGSESTRGG